MEKETVLKTYSGKFVLGRKMVITAAVIGKKKANTPLFHNL